MDVEWSSYQMSWRLLGFYLDCGYSEDDDDGRRRLSGSGEGGCQRMVLYGVYVDPNYEGNGLYEYEYYSKYYGNWTCYGDECRERMDCHLPETNWQLLGVFKIDNVVSGDGWMEQLFKHEGVCIMTYDDYEITYDGREVFPDSCNDSGEIDSDGNYLYYDSKPTIGGGYTIGLYTDSFCTQEYTGSDFDPFSLSGIDEDYVDEFNSAMSIFQICQPCVSYDVRAEDFYCYDTAGYENVDQCMKFGVKAYAVAATQNDVILAARQQTIVGFELNGETVGTGGFGRTDDYDLITKMRNQMKSGYGYFDKLSHMFASSGMYDTEVETEEFPFLTSIVFLLCTFLLFNYMLKNQGLLHYEITNESLLEDNDANTKSQKKNFTRRSFLHSSVDFVDSSIDAVGNSIVGTAKNILRKKESRKSNRTEIDYASDDDYEVVTEGTYVGAFIKTLDSEPADIDAERTLLKTGSLENIRKSLENKRPLVCIPDVPDDITEEETLCVTHGGYSTSVKPNTSMEALRNATAPLPFEPNKDFIEVRYRNKSNDDAHQGGDTKKVGTVLVKKDKANIDKSSPKQESCNDGDVAICEKLKGVNQVTAAVENSVNIDITQVEKNASEVKKSTGIKDLMVEKNASAVKNPTGIKDLMVEKNASEVKKPTGIKDLMSACHEVTSLPLGKQPAVRGSISAGRTRPKIVEKSAPVRGSMSVGRARPKIGDLISACQEVTSLPIENSQSNARRKTTSERRSVSPNKARKRIDNEFTDFNPNSSSIMVDFNTNASNIMADFNTNASSIMALNGSPKRKKGKEYLSSPKREAKREAKKKSEPFQNNPFLTEGNLRDQSPKKKDKGRLKKVFRSPLKKRSPSGSPSRPRPPSRTPSRDSSRTPSRSSSRNIYEKGDKSPSH
eukprot:CAMPEP_0194304906 /NCGR_PEP_ID=MMETSP0171-20130528/2484_1 /TAXON_ID=218684 /ORGANISM="Corethron pennatum, Strain L29A3" /LENGTH=896 /DNA_ID=CAMNT_0039056281 /DNA_START=285 /DNA_END=2975 /DNA_ORIENTATION=+